MCQKKKNFKLPQNLECRQAAISIPPRGRYKTYFVIFCGKSRLCTVTIGPRVLAFLLIFSRIKFVSGIFFKNHVPTMYEANCKSRTKYIIVIIINSSKRHKYPRELRSESRFYRTLTIQIR